MNSETILIIAVAAVAAIAILEPAIAQGGSAFGSSVGESLGITAGIGGTVLIAGGVALLFLL